ncbi:MAG: hypothetical protein GFH27_549301n238 [Chloroflexi bacterium AL-W]|nr:hypothetical protein [Chloroflexi bacterium AL-N1]NOK68432.1 hypothetical protein [Chloroflexi bacterium AL-N10]NOK74078.1 hypothetical protein [Chloroflexi bacterium AL-N5]NOK83045.1 hypothetical protein [Chloroflexi bacterium AL-W]NOK90568.1 hypothetical protein [Chloroflexi bacterium AL-N15]
MTTKRHSITELISTICPIVAIAMAIITIPTIRVLSEADGFYFFLIAVPIMIISSILSIFLGIFSFKRFQKQRYLFGSYTGMLILFVIVIYLLSPWWTS